MMKNCLGILFMITICLADPLVIKCPADHRQALSVIDISPGKTGVATSVPASTITFNDDYDQNDDIRRLIIRKWTATNGGNTDSCLQFLRIFDNVSPEFNSACPSDQTVECDNIPAAATLGASDPNGYDSFVDVGFTQNDNNSPTPDRTITRTWVIVDDNLNSASCRQTITVQDTTDPSITCPADVSIAVTDDPSPNNLGTATGSDATCWDNVSGYVLNITHEDALGATGDEWLIIERTWYATDGSDNSVTCQQLINVSCTDPDGDGVCNESGCSANFQNYFDCNDNCPDDANPGQQDDDADGLGNACDSCPYDFNPGPGQVADADGDDIPDACDVCVNNIDNTDADNDNWGDACGDCDDSDANINPDATEIFDGNGVDENCDDLCDMQNVTFIEKGTAATKLNGKICTPGQDQHQADENCQTECQAWASAKSFITSGDGGPSGSCIVSNPDKSTHNECKCVTYKLVAC